MADITGRPGGFSAARGAWYYWYTCPVCNHRFAQDTPTVSAPPLCHPCYTGYGRRIIVRVAKPRGRMGGMKAKCPHCEDGCDRCQDGFIEVAFPSGPGITRYNKQCRDCGASAGGCFGGPGLPPPGISEQAICPGCGGRNLALVEVQS